MVPRATFLYSLANFGTSLSSFVVSTYVGFFYIAVVGLPPRWVGWGLFAFSWWNALNDPLLGWLSDRTRTRWGRRVPYIALLAPPLSLTFAAIWRPPASLGGQVGSLAYMLGTITVNDLLYSMVALNVVALLPEMYPVLRERAVANGWRQVMSLIGMLLGAAAAPLLAQRFGWPATGLVLATAVLLALLISLKGIREHRVYAQASGPGFRSAFAGVLRHRAFLVFLGITFLGRMALTTVNATVPFYASYVLGLGTRGASLLLGLALLAAVVSMPVWAWLLARWGARRTLLTAQVMVGAALLPLLLVRSREAAMITCTAAGFSIAGLLITPDVMLADVADADHIFTGQRHEGTYFGLANFVNRLPNVLQAVVIGEMLTFAGFNVGLAAQPGPVLAGLRGLISLVPAVAMALALLLTWVYPLHGARLASVRAEVAVLRARTEGADVEKGVQHAT
jgi:glycoside/pentoside/hexuronide:cation symporter, GPH family